MIVILYTMRVLLKWNYKKEWEGNMIITGSYRNHLVCYESMQKFNQSSRFFVRIYLTLSNISIKVIY